MCETITSIDEVHYSPMVKVTKLVALSNVFEMRVVGMALRSYPGGGGALPFRIGR